MSLGGEVFEKLRPYLISSHYLLLVSHPKLSLSQLTYDGPMRVAGWVGAVWVSVVLFGQVRSQESFPYIQEEVSIPNPSASGVTLAGTFTKLSVDRKLPAVLMITGAGQQDRNETTAGHRPFLVIADYLTRKGMAVLRLDDRGVGKSKGKFEGATTQDFASDMQAAVQYLRTRPDIDTKYIGLLGHGEGAIIAAMLASKNPQIAFLVLLSPPAVSGQDVLLEQTAQAEAVAGVPDEQIEADQKIGAQLYKLVAEGKKESDLKEALKKSSKRIPAPVLQNWQQQLHRLDNPWLKFFLTYNPATALEHVTCPVLALYGEKDLQVIAEQNAPELESALKRAHNRDITILVLPKLNYMFQTANTGLSGEYATIRETISPVPVELIATWLTKRTKQDGALLTR